MPQTFSRLLVLIAILCLIILALLGCTQGITVTPETTLTLEPTVTEKFIPIPPRNAEQVVIFSYEEDGYAHLFAYIPGKLPLTRITSGDWDDITPATSVDGEKIAFTSNRSGYWDLYLLELSSGDITQLTDTPEYEGAPTWSPDGSFMAFESYDNENLNIVVGPANDPRNDAVHLTTSPASEHSPAWAPDGRHIAFISDGEVILADLDLTDSDRFQNLSNTELAVESHPVWSADGSRLAWSSSSQSVGRSGIYLWDASRNTPATWIGDGNWPAWNPSGDQIITTLMTPNNTYLTTYSADGKLLQALTPFPAAALRGLTWANLILPDPLPQGFQQAAQLTPAPLWAPNGEPVSEGSSGRWSLVNLPDVQAPYPQMHDLANEAFDALRERVQQEVGWDALASLENAFVPITSSLDPGFAEDWLYTGRAFAINSLMTNAGWMVAVREDLGAQTYWRLYLRAQLQDGSLGEPLRDTPWDLSARYNLDPKIYERGGKYSDVPPGYWVDVTALAIQYGWERVPALPNWRTFYRGARFTEFALTDRLDWYSAMLQLYPPEVLVTPTRVLPPTITPSRTPPPTRTPLPTAYPAPNLHPLSYADAHDHTHSNRDIIALAYSTDDHSMKKFICHGDEAISRFLMMGLLRSTHNNIILASLLTLIIASCRPVTVTQTGPTPTAVIAGETATQPAADVLPRATIAPFRFVLPTPGAEPVSGWRPPLYPVPWAVSAYDHFYFARPIAADNVNWPLAEYRYGGVFFAPNIVHTGVDIDAQEDTQILAAGPGTVVSADWGLYTEAPGNITDPYGQAVVLRHDFGYKGQALYTVYAHMSRIIATIGQHVETGDVIGLVGDTGATTGPHLHFEVRLGGNTFYNTYNPELWMAPPQGWGVLVGRLTDEKGKLLNQFPVDVRPMPSEVPLRKVLTYAEGAVNADEYYQENLVLSDLPAGLYKIVLEYKDKDLQFWADIYPGQVTYFTFTDEDGFRVLPPPVPTLDFLPGTATAVP